MNTSRKSALNRESSSLLEKSRPEPASAEMTEWLTAYNLLQSRLFKARND